MILIRKLNGRKVFSSDAKTIGEVAGAYVDLETWKITHISVDLSEEAIELFGYEKPRIPIFGNVSVCIPITAVKLAGDVITLKVPFEELQSLPIGKCKK